MKAFFVKRGIYPKFKHDYVVEFGSPLPSGFPRSYLPDVLFSLILDGLITVNEFNRLAGIIGDDGDGRLFLRDLILYSDVFLELSKYCYQEKELEQNVFWIIPYAPTFSIMLALANRRRNFVIDISFLNTVQLQYVLRYCSLYDVLVCSYFRWDILPYVSKIILDTRLNLSQLLPKLPVSIRNFAKNDFITLEIKNGDFSICNDTYEFIEFKGKRVPKEPEPTLSGKEYDILDEVLNSGGIVTFKMLYEVLKDIKPIVKLVNASLLELRQGQVSITGRGLRFYEAGRKKSD